MPDTCLTPLSTLIHLIQNPDKVDELLAALDKAARGHSSYEYGLPLHDDSVRAAFREILYRWCCAGPLK